MNQSENYIIDIDVEGDSFSSLTSDIVLGQIEEQSINSAQDRIDDCFSLSCLPVATKREAVAFEGRNLIYYIEPSLANKAITNLPQESGRNLSTVVIVKTTAPYANVFSLHQVLPHYLQDRFFPDFFGIRESVEQLFQGADNDSGVLQQASIDEIIPDECLEFCESYDLVETFYDCVRQAKQDFESVEKIQAELGYFHDDDEFDDEPHITIEVKVNTSRETAEGSYDRWLDWFIVKVPDSVRKFFILTIDRG